MALPSITPLPQAPSRSDGPAAFNALADPFIAALPPFVLQANTLAAAINDALIGIASSVNAAASSASASAGSAAAANASKDAAAQQVGLAADQVALANIAKGEAQAAALAAGAAAGLPPERVPFSVLQINAAGGIGWGFGLPDRAAAQVGYSLILGPGKVPAWGFAGDQIGDILYTSRAPGATYLPANGGIYLQSAFPQLFAQIGLISGQRATAFVAKSTTPRFAQMAFGENGIVLGVSDTAGTVGNVYRSTDYGLTFTLAATAITTGSVLQILHLGGSKWLFGVNSSNQIQISSDNGSTYTTVTIASNFVMADTDKAGTVLMYAGSALYRSINGGLNFTALSFPSGNLICYAGLGRWVANFSGNSANVFVSDDAFSTYAVRSLNGTVNGSVGSIVADVVSGTVVLVSTNGGAAIANAATSFDRGETFSIKIAGAAYPPTSVTYTGGDTWLILCRQTDSAYEIRKSTDGAKTFTQGPVVSTQVSPWQLVSDQLKGYVIANCRAAGAGSYSFSAPVLGYDGATQFKLPTFTKQEGVSPYVKAV